MRITLTPVRTCGWRTRAASARISRSRGRARARRRSATASASVRRWKISTMRSRKSPMATSGIPRARETRGRRPRTFETAASRRRRPPRQRTNGTGSAPSSRHSRASSSAALASPRTRNVAVRTPSSAPTIRPSSTTTLRTISSSSRRTRCCRRRSERPHSSTPSRQSNGRLRRIESWRCVPTTRARRAARACHRCPARAPGRSSSSTRAGRTRRLGGRGSRRPTTCPGSTLASGCTSRALTLPWRRRRSRPCSSTSPATATFRSWGRPTTARRSR